MTTFLKVDGPLMSLDFNKEERKIAVAGRKTFKIYALNNKNEITEEVDMKGNDNLNLNHSFTNVAWNWNDDAMLATSAANGAIIIWNLHRTHNSKQERVFLEHRRTVNRIGFHHTEPWLISCSQDTTIRCFDYRMKESFRIFKSNTESIRDVKFSPHNTNTFAAVSESGSLQIWDVRRHDKFFSQYTAAHSEPIFSLDWHPECKWIATGSRDKLIKVWDVSNSKPALKYTINTIASVGCVKWRPQKKYQLASTSLVVDWNINIWNLKRPYIPSACLKGHRDIVSDVVWRSESKSLVSVGKDCFLYHHVLDDAIRPADSVMPQGLTFSCKGDVAFTYKLNTSPVAKMSKAEETERDGQKGDFFPNISVLNIFFEESLSKSECIIQFAKSYILKGQSFFEMCDHNSSIAKSLGKLNISFVWDIIKHIFSYELLEIEKPNEKGEMSAVKELDPEVPNNEADISKELTTKSHDRYDIVRHESKTQTDELVADSGILSGDFIFGDKDMDPLSQDDDICENLGNELYSIYPDKFDITEIDWKLPSEAFTLRHKLGDIAPPDIITEDDTEVLYHDYDDSIEEILSNFKMLNCEKEPTHIKPAEPSPWTGGDSIAKVLQYHADIGDIQTPVCVLLVLGERRSLLTTLSEQIQEQWLTSYIDLLKRYELRNLAVEIVNLSWISEVHQSNQHMTTIRTVCNGCHRGLNRSGWLCDQCRSSFPSLCNICHKVVKGLFMWCQGCNHGGHLEHIRSWLMYNKFCPSGCGHACEY